MIDHQSIIEKISAVPLVDGRRIVAIVGGPASGKSTLAAELQNGLPNTCVVPMDGFHRSNDDLEEHGLLSRKGAPETFDVAGFINMIQSLRKPKITKFPMFDRTSDCVVENGGQVKLSDKTILVEGNYLLLDVDPWNKLAVHWDFSILLDVSIDLLEKRLMERWQNYGHDLASATQKAEKNDLPNARLVLANVLAADLVLSQK